MAAGGAGPTGTHPSHIDIHIEDIREEHSYLATAPEEGTNGHKTQLPVEGQLLQILANLYRQLDEQRAEADHVREDTALERDAEAHI